MPVIRVNVPKSQKKLTDQLQGLSEFFSTLICTFLFPLAVCSCCGIQSNIQDSYYSYITSLWHLMNQQFLSQDGLMLLFFQPLNPNGHLRREMLLFFPLQGQDQVTFTSLAYFAPLHLTSYFFVIC